jgi:tellurite resistance protein TerC
MTTQRAVLWSLFWIVCAGFFSGGLYALYGIESAITFFTCYTVEKLLSLDNLFMFYVIFRYYGCKEHKQRKILNIGIISAVILRACLILPGLYLVNRFNFLIYGFAVFLLYASYKIFFSKSDEIEDEPPALVKPLQKWLGSTALIIASIELADLLFALDSIPAGFGITTNAFLLYAANIFAILGLRSMYFILQNSINKFIYLEPAVGIVLSIVGFKMLLQHWFFIPDYLLLSSIITILITAVIASKLHYKELNECIL